MSIIFCIICKKVIKYNGKPTQYTLYTSCSYENLSDEQKKILKEQRRKLNTPY